MKKLVIFLLLFFLACPSYAAYRKAKSWEGKPPAGSTIDWSNPLSQGLVGCWLLNEGSGRKSYDLTTPGGVATLNTGVNFGTQGITGTKHFNSNGISMPATKAFKSPYVFTYAFGIIINGAGANNDGKILSLDAASNTVFDHNQTSFSLHAKLVTPGDANPDAISDTVQTLTLGKLYNVVATYNDNGDRKVYFYINGIPATYSTQQAAGGAGLIGWNGALLGDLSGVGARSLNGLIAYWYVYNRALSPSEIQSLYVSPYQFIIAPKRRIISPTTNITPGNTKNRTFIID